ncbi:hypothetical protein [Streptomyces sp. NPDC048516]|uniref:hypothetical protein n=1 Tax=Streptomyces sp. NPDC048516 TaxID=3365565 RepID=UPI00371E87E4
MIIDRKHSRMQVRTDPGENGYGSHRAHAPGEQVTHPALLGAEVRLDAEALPRAGRD